MSRNQIYILAGGCLLALCGIVALVGGIFILSPRFVPQRTPVAEVVSVSFEPRPNANDNSMGDPNAPIVMEEFSDFQCPFCERFHEETEPLLRQYYIEPGKVRFVYRSMGNWLSANIGSGTESQDAALAAYCAGDQNKFWEMHDLLFANVLGENVGSFSEQRLKLIAETANLRMDEFTSCFDSNKYGDRVQQDLEDGNAANIQGTPSFLLTYVSAGETKTILIEGAQPFNVFQQELEAILNEITP